MLLIRAIASGLNNAVTIASRIADGQLGNQIDANRTDGSARDYGAQANG